MFSKVFKLHIYICVCVHIWDTSILMSFSELAHFICLWYQYDGPAVSILKHQSSKMFLFHILIFWKQLPLLVHKLLTAPDSWKAEALPSGDTWMCVLCHRKTRHEVQQGQCLPAQTTPRVPQAGRTKPQVCLDTVMAAKLAATPR